jgi:probable F420-dependent oxidoreductase
MTVAVGKIGIWSSSRQWPAEAKPRAEAAAELEDLGYGALWIGSAAGDLELPAAVLAATHRISVATGIVNIWTEPAATVAANYTTVARDHPGRFLLGVGAGHPEAVERTGQHYERPYRALVNYLDILDASSPPVPEDGRVLAALGPRVLALAGDRTAGAHPYLVTPEHTRQAREILGPGPLLAPEQMVVLEADPERARAIARATLKLYLGLRNYTNNLLRLGYTADDFAAGGSDRLVDGVIAWGEVETVAARVAQHLDAGADHVCVQVLSDEPSRLPRARWRALSAEFARRSLIKI